MSGKKPIILITSDSNFSSTQNTVMRTLQMSKAYCAAVANAGGVPVVTGEFCPEELVELADGLLLSGGDDIDPSYFGESLLNESVHIDPPRDAFEFALIRPFLKTGKPILSICRGFQILNVVMGGTLYQDLVAERGLIHMDSRIRHEVTATPGTFLYRTFGEKFRTNSTHHQAVKEVAPGLIVSARSIEGIIEAYEHESLPILGTQFHPERLTGAQWDARTPDFKPLFEHFVSLVNENRKKG